MLRLDRRTGKELHDKTRKHETEETSEQPLPMAEPNEIEADKGNAHP
jgi:hypothetical protein